MSVNPNGEAEVLKIYFKPRPRLKKVIVDLDFSTLAIKGRQSQGNLFSRYGIHKIVLKERGTSTLGGQNVWFDEDVRRLNADGRGTLLGEFKGDDKIIVWTSKNQYYITGYDLGQHFPDETVRVSRYEADRIYSVCYYDRSQQYYYMKRFTAEMSDKMQFFLDEEGQADLVAVTERTGAKLEITYKGAHASRPADEIDVDEFVGVKSHRAKGKRLTTYDVVALRFIEPELPPEPEPSDDDAPDDTPSGGGASAGAQGGSGNGAADRAADRAVGGSNGDAADRGAALSGGVGSAVSSGANSATEGPDFAPASSAADNPGAPGRPGGDTAAPAHEKPAAADKPAAERTNLRQRPLIRRKRPRRPPACPVRARLRAAWSSKSNAPKAMPSEVIDPEQLNLF